MRLSDDQIRAIKQITHQIAGETAHIWVFGSRLDDTAFGGDLDLLLDLAETIEHPALIAAQLSAKISRMMLGRKVDVLISAPNLKHLPIHDIAFKEGIRL